MKRSRFLLMAAALLMGCGGETLVPVTTTIAGRWQGSLDTGLIFDLTLTQQGATVTGTGQIGIEGSMDAATVSGSYSAPSPQVNLILERPGTGLAAFNYSGTHSGNQISGVLNGGLATNRPLTLTKQ